MTQKQRTAQSAPATSAASWDLRHPGLVMRGNNGEEIHEFTGMWPLKPDADLVAITDGTEPQSAPIGRAP
jgi:hypothetical protein